MRKRIRLAPAFNRKIGLALHDYSMLSDGDNVMIAVSGGIDSLVLARVLKMWQKKAPIRFKLTAQIIDHGFWRQHDNVAAPEVSIGSQLERFHLNYVVDRAWDISDDERTCFQCARNRRSQLFDLARERGFNKIALGHHKDDLIETFFLNILYSGNISTMLPRQLLFDGDLSIIRPFAYVEKQELVKVSKELELTVVANLCPLAKNTRREKVRGILNSFYEEEPGVKRSLFAALANVRQDYML
jgi:tRNA 2-thiocytidine biosynthesis protein TtcA